MYCEDYFTAEDTGNSYCEDCHLRQIDHCEHCEENYEDIDYHNTHTHAVCSECESVLEDSNELYNHNVENHPELMIELAAY